MDTKKGIVRDTNIELLRIVTALMVLTYHVINSCFDFNETSNLSKIIVADFFWGGGRTAVNIFVIISAWYLCDSKFKIKRILEVWGTTWLYAVSVGIAFFVKQGNGVYLIKQLFPIINFSVWFISVYLMMLLISPMLNRILKSGLPIRKLLILLFTIQCIIPTFYPASKLRFGNIGWFCLLYLFIGELKHRPIAFFNKKRNCFFLILICWHVSIGVYFLLPFLQTYPIFNRIISFLGIYPNIYFADLASLPCFFTAIGFFYLFKNINIESTAIKENIEFISGVTLDVYILLAMESPEKVLFWIELLNLKSYITGDYKLIKIYALICIAFLSTVLLGNLRKKMYLKLIDTKRIKRFIGGIDSKMDISI